MAEKLMKLNMIFFGVNVWILFLIHGPSGWATKYPKSCAGKRQSPIDIKVKDTKYESMKPLSFSSNIETVPSGPTLQIGNNKHSYRIYLKKNHFYVSGGALPGRFNVFSFHFHWGSDDPKGSEHNIDGKKYPAEMHFVNWNTKYADIYEALKYEDGLAAIAVFLEVGESENKALSSFLKYAENVTHPKEIYNLTQTYPISDLLPNVTSSFYRYNGSLTTPECQEIVTWTVFKEHGTITTQQLALLRSLKYSNASSGNDLTDTFRPVQALNNRVVYRSFDPSSGSALKATSVMALIVMAVLAFLNNMGVNQLAFGFLLCAGCLQAIFAGSFDYSSLSGKAKTVYNLTQTHRLSDLLPVNTSHFYRYDGSLTTPHCNQVVTWTIFKNAASISTAQLALLRGLKENNVTAIVNNYRPVQDLNGRTIKFTYKPPVDGPDNGAHHVTNTLTTILALIMAALFNYAVARKSEPRLVSFAVGFSLVTKDGEVSALRDETKGGCEGDWDPFHSHKITRKSGGVINIERRVINIERRVIIIESWVVIIERRVIIIERRVIIIERWVVIIESWVVIIERRVIIIERRVIIIESWVVIIERWVIIIERRVIIIESWVVIIERRVIIIERRVIIIESWVVIIERRVIIIERRVIIIESCVVIIERVIIIERRVIIIESWVVIIERRVIIIESWVVIIESWVVIIERRVIIIERRVIIIESWVVIIERWVIIIERRVIIIERRVIIIESWVVIIERWVIIIERRVIIIERRVIIIESWVVIIERRVIIIESWVVIIESAIMERGVVCIERRVVIMERRVVIIERRVVIIERRVIIEEDHH
ncbi:hypothetical protein QZH41_020757 [Actinostola sp. cb2023]|nr:hypothetical protein QZH41_020757 [Actinostola sp. cb2023]